jgi:hypothetical protein
LVAIVAWSSAIAAGRCCAAAACCTAAHYSRAALGSELFKVSFEHGVHMKLRCHTVCCGSVSGPASRHMHSCKVAGCLAGISTLAMIAVAYTQRDRGALPYHHNTADLFVPSTDLQFTSAPSNHSILHLQCCCTRPACVCSFT